MKSNYAIVAYVILALIILLSFFIRTANVDNLKDITTNTWTLGPDLDPFLYLRLAQEIIEYGHELSPDYMRYLGKAPVYQNLVTYGIVGLYRFLSIFSDSNTIEFSAIIFPVIMSVLTAIAFFLFARKIFYKEKDLIKFLDFDHRDKIYKR